MLHWECSSLLWHFCNHKLNLKPLRGGFAFLDTNLVCPISMSLIFTYMVCLSLTLVFCSLTSVNREDTKWNITFMNVPMIWSSSGLQHLNFFALVPIWYELNRINLFFAKSQSQQNITPFPALIMHYKLIQQDKEH